MAYGDARLLLAYGTYIKTHPQIPQAAAETRGISSCAHTHTRWTQYDTTQTQTIGTLNIASQTQISAARQPNQQTYISEPTRPHQSQPMWREDRVNSFNALRARAALLGADAVLASGALRCVRVERGRWNQTNQVN